jgi:hypothetical protein
MADLIRRDLIDGDAGLDVRPGGLLHAHAGEEGAAGARVVARAIGTGRGIDVVHAAEHLQLVLHGSKRLHGAGQFEILAFALGPPVRLDGAVREIDERHAERSAGGGLRKVAGDCLGGERTRGDERFKRRQSHAGAKAAQEAAAAQAGEALGGEVLDEHVFGFHGSNLVGDWSALTPALSPRRGSATSACLKIAM